MPTHNYPPACTLSALRRTVRMGWLCALALLALCFSRIADAQTYRVDTVKTTFEFAPQLVEDISGFDIDSAGRLHVFEAAQKRVRVYLEDGTHLKDRPTGLGNTWGLVAVLPDSTLVVADNTSREFRAYDYDDNLLWTQPYFEANYLVSFFGPTADGSLVAGVGFYASGQNYSKAWVIYPNGQLRSSWLTNSSLVLGIGNGNTVLAVDADPDPRTVTESTLDGTVLRTFHYSRPIASAGWPNDAIEDGNGGLWVADGGGYVVHIDRQGNVLGQLGSKGSGPGEHSSAGYVVIRDSKIFVGDNTKRSISIFSPNGIYHSNILSIKWRQLGFDWPDLIRLGPDETCYISFSNGIGRPVLRFDSSYRVTKSFPGYIDWMYDDNYGTQIVPYGPWAPTILGGCLIPTYWPETAHHIFEVSPFAQISGLHIPRELFDDREIQDLHTDTAGNSYVTFSRSVEKYDKNMKLVYSKSIASYPVACSRNGTLLLANWWSAVKTWTILDPDGNSRTFPAPPIPLYNDNNMLRRFDRNGDILSVTDRVSIVKHDDNGNHIGNISIEDGFDPDDGIRDFVIQRDGTIVALLNNAVAWLKPQWTETTAPTSTAVVAPAAPATGWHLGPVEVTFNSADDRHGSGLKRFLLDIDGTVDILPDPLPDLVKRTFTTAGTHTIRYHGEDHAGNAESANTLVVRIDLAEPQVQASVVNRVLTLSATDDASGIEWIRYRVDNGPELTYSGPVTLPLTAKVVRYQVRDKAGRQSPQQSRVIGQFLKRVLFTPATAHAGATVTVKVELLAAAPSGGVVLDLSSTKPGILAAPATISIPSGSASGSFTTTLGPVDDDTSVQLRASFAGTSISGGLVVLRPAPKTLTITPSALFGGETATGTLVLRAKAPAGGQVVELTSLAPATLGVPPTVTVPAGSDTARFTISSSVVDSDQAVLVSAVIGGRVATAMVTVRRNGPVSLTVSPTSVTGGTGTVGKVTLQRIAPAGGLLVDLRSTDPEVTVPAQVLVPAGQRMATFAIATTAVSADLTAGIRAQRAGLSVEATLGILAPRLATLTVAPTKLTGGLSAVGTVSLSGPAPAGGILVELASTHGSASVPSTVLVPAGSSVATFPITTTAVAVDTTATISAVSNLDTRTAVVTIRP